MMNYKEFMEKTKVTKRKYVEDWLNNDLIPGVKYADDIENAQFPDSSRRPYNPHTKNLPASKIYCHILKACNKKEHVLPKTFSIDQTEFDSYINNLENEKYIVKRVVDGIEYYDLTMLGSEYTDNKIEEIFFKLVESATKGQTSAVLARFDKT